MLTTAIFWGLELGAYAAFHTQTARYVGGAVGLALGYWLKYQLDKRLVFGGSAAGGRGAPTGVGTGAGANAAAVGAGEPAPDAS